MNRRTFLHSSAILAAFAPMARAAEEKSATATPPFSAPAAAPMKPRRTNKKGLMFQTLNSPTAKALSLRDRFKLAHDAGFVGVEVPSAMAQADVLAARDAVGIEIP